MNDPSVELLLLPTEEQVRNKYNAVELDPGDAFDKVLLAELALINKWAHSESKLVYWSYAGTGAHPVGLIGIHRPQIDDLYGKFEPQAFRTALFMVLAHESGHICQFKHYGLDQTQKLPRRYKEAHADILSGVWLGLRLYGGDLHLPDNIRAAAMQLTSTASGPNAYPSANQRAAAIAKGASLAILLAQAQNWANLEPAERVTATLQLSDVVDLYRIAGQEVDATPNGDS